MAECTLSIISWFLPEEDLSECSLLSTNACPSLISLNHCPIPKSPMNHIVDIWAWVPTFLAKLDADMLLRFLGHCQCTTHNSWFWLTEQSRWETIIHTLTWRSKITCTTLLAPSAFLFERKKNVVGYFVIRPYTFQSSLKLVSEFQMYPWRGVGVFHVQEAGTVGVVNSSN
jgi:hypothetical protein